jgi:hypothetical protein
VKPVAGAVNGEGGVTPATAPRQGELDPTDAKGAEAMDRRGGPMAEKRPRPDAQNSSHEEGLAGQPSVANRVDVVMDAVQTTNP